MRTIINEITYEIIRGSDIQRDGMFLEARIIDSNPLEVIAEIFYSDITHELTLTCFMNNIPLSLIETLIVDAKKYLPPSDRIFRNDN